MLPAKLTIAVLILAAYVFLVNVTELSPTVGWVMGLVAFVLAIWDWAAAATQRP